MKRQISDRWAATRHTSASITGEDEPFIYQCLDGISIVVPESVAAVLNFDKTVELFPQHQQSSFNVELN